MVKNVDVKSVIEQLEVLNVCSRCLLRFLGTRSYSSYVSKEEVHEAIRKLTLNSDDPTLSLSADDGDRASKRLHVTPCSSCLGVLQDECDDMVLKVESSAKKSGFQFSDFVLQLSLPVVIDLRQNLIVLYLKDKLGSAYEKDLNDIPTVKEVWKWVVGFQFGKITKAEFTPLSKFQITVSIVYEDTVKECKPLMDSFPEAFPNRKKKKAKPDEIYNRTSVMKAIEKLSSDLKNLYQLPPAPPDKGCVYEDIVCTHSPLYLGGRYNKYSRELSQTPWIVDGERRMESSVQELIANVVQKHILADTIIFSASGREDVDVKMLGNGRPFVLELINPRRIAWSTEEIKDIENAINSGTDVVSVKDLQIVSKKDTQYLKEGEEQKRKTYNALCIVKKVLQPDDLLKLRSITDTVVKQKTPIRVLHRRTLATRDKIIHKIDGTILGPHQIELKIETQAGTYVKEFVHSDFGRTVPSLGTLLESEADILELDVISVHLDWPPSMSPESSTQK